MTVNSYFGTCDKKSSDKDKSIVNTIPLWTNETNTTDLKKQLDDMNMKEKEGGMTGKVKARFLTRKKKIEDMYDYVLESDPRGKMSSLETDRANRVFKSFGEKIGLTMPTKSDMETPHKVKPAQLAKVAKTPCLKLENEDEIREAKLSNLKVKNGMVSKDDMYRAYYNIGKILEKNTHPEELRRPGLTPSGRDGYVGYDPKFSEAAKDLYSEKPLNNIEDNKSEKIVKMWTCPDCGEEKKLSQKGVHIGRLCPKKKELVTA